MHKKNKTCMYAAYKTHFRSKDTLILKRRDGKVLHVTENENMKLLHYLYKSLFSPTDLKCHQYCFLNFLLFWDLFVDVLILLHAVYPCSKI